MCLCVHVHENVVLMRASAHTHTHMNTRARARAHTHKRTHTQTRQARESAADQGGQARLHTRRIRRRSCRTSPCTPDDVHERGASARGHRHAIAIEGGRRAFIGHGKEGNAGAHAQGFDHERARRQPHHKLRPCGANRYRDNGHGPGDAAARTHCADEELLQPHPDRVLCSRGRPQRRRPQRRRRSAAERAQSARPVIPRA